MGNALAILADPTTKADAADLVAMLDRLHFLDARLVAAGVEVRTAQAAADAANTAAEAAFVDGSPEAMRAADGAADAASASLAKAKRRVAALRSTRVAALSDLEHAMGAARMSLHAAADAQVQAIEAKYAAAARKAAGFHAEALAIAYAADHPNAPYLTVMTIPASFTAGDAPLQAGAPGQTPPELPKGGSALAETAALLRAAERLLAERIIEL